ncbi:serine/threonine-protein kinase [Amycolatopsis samaneae]|uniref:non-specific serine/threonine protein kinase n=1 Tax=Amycolatopsis samaneae TaxID=664691 RepID=A0ABW5GEV3_9PSEU
MGTVWSAYDEFLHRPVAVKEMKLPPGVPAAQADELRERTLREARAIAVLSHPNVIILHDVARDNDEPFVVMELLPSRSLAHILRDHGPLTVPQAAAVGIAVAAALEAAHAAGITHRDVKPGNVLVAGDGRIKLTDFGIARNVSEATMTRTGIMLGSPAYIAPEVASGGAVVPAADLWGLGATLFAAIEGTAPYDADGDPLETVGKVVNGKVPKPSPGQLADVISALMRKEPSKRISLRDVRHRLYPLQAESAIDLFGPELFRTPDGKKTSAQPDATDTQIIKTVTPEPQAENSVALAADPGPLPFLRGSESPASASASLPALPASASAALPALPPAPAPAGPPAPVPPPLTPPTAPAAPASPARRSVKTSAVLTVVSVLIFLLAAGGGFALARTVGGQPLLPPAAGSPVSTGQPVVVPPPVLVTQQGNSNAVNGVKGGQFSLDVPEGWLKFASPHQLRSGSTSTMVQFVSPDGRQVITVERLAGFLTGGAPARYLSEVQRNYPGDAFFLAKQAPLTGQNGLAVTYRTTERATGRSDGSGPVTRSTFANLIQAKNDLWVLSLTAPSEQEDSARTGVFDRVAPTLKID